MATRKKAVAAKVAAAGDGARTSSSVDDMLLAALERGDETFQTGRFLATFKEGAAEAGYQALGTMHGLRVADLATSPIR
jgi:hypothetical protein